MNIDFRKRETLYSDPVIALLKQLRTNFRLGCIIIVNRQVIPLVAKFVSVSEGNITCCID